MKILRNLLHKPSWPGRASSQREASRYSSTDCICSHDYFLINCISGKIFSKWLHKSNSEVYFLEWTCQTKPFFPLWNQFSCPSLPSVPHEMGKWTLCWPGISQFHYLQLVHLKILGFLLPEYTTLFSFLIQMNCNHYIIFVLYHVTSLFNASWHQCVQFYGLI